jgi:hypothetical protein
MSLWNLGADYSRKLSLQALAADADIHHEAQMAGGDIPIEARIRNMNSNVSTSQSGIQNSLAALGKYIPAETTTIFLAWLGLIASLKNGSQGHPQIPTIILDGWFIYMVCAVCTPLFVYLAARTMWRQNTNIDADFRLPLWRMGAATISFLIWGLAVPGFIDNYLLTTVVSFLIIFMSPILVMIEQAFGLS